MGAIVAALRRSFTRRLSVSFDSRRRYRRLSFTRWARRFDDAVHRREEGVQMETSDIVLLAQPTVWMLGILAAFWVYVEALNASLANEWRIRLLSEITALLIIAVALLGGYWVDLLHSAGPAVVIKGQWPWVGKIVVAAKENLFFIPLLLALYLPIIASKSLTRFSGARAVVMITAGLIVLGGLAIQGANSLANSGAKAAFAPVEIGAQQ
jgi:hypothetical protein